MHEVDCELVDLSPTFPYWDDSRNDSIPWWEAAKVFWSLAKQMAHVLNHVNICADFQSKMSVQITSGAIFILTAWMHLLQLVISTIATCSNLFPPSAVLSFEKRSKMVVPPANVRRLSHPPLFFFFFSPGDHFHNVKKVKEKVIEKSVKSALPQIEYLKRSQIDRDTAQLFKSWSYPKESFCYSFKTSRPPACSEMGCSKGPCKWQLPGTLLHCYDNSQTTADTQLSYTFYYSLWNSNTEAPLRSVLSQRGVMSHKRGHNFATFPTRNVGINVYLLQTVFPWSTVQWNNKKGHSMHMSMRKNLHLDISCLSN